MSAVWEQDHHWESPSPFILFTLSVVLQVTGVGYNGVGEVLLEGEMVHGFSCPAISKIVEVKT